MHVDVCLVLTVFGLFLDSRGEAKLIAKVAHTKSWLGVFDCNLSAFSVHGMECSKYLFFFH